MFGDCIRDFDFKKITEIDHGKTYSIGKDFNITSYQFNPLVIDSSIVIEANDICLLNSNDAKVFGLSLKQILSNHKQFDFVFRSHSSAGPIPHCIRGADPMKSDRSPSDFCNDFINFGKATKGKYLIPFASSHIYLHPESKKYNAYYSNPQMVKDIFEKRNNTDQICVLMPSGSSWSKELGFEITNHDYSQIEKHVNDATKKNKEKIDRFLKRNEKSFFVEKYFHDYYRKFLKSTLFPLNLPFKFAFLIEENSTNSLFLCIIDGRNKNTRVLKIKNESEIFQNKLSFIIKTSALIFNDCNKKFMHNTFAASKLLEIILISSNSRGNLNKHLALVDFYENDYLPITKLLSVRNVLIFLRRWREVFDNFY